MEMTDRGLFEPDVLLTEQFSAARRRRATISSEKRLMLAVLENALDYYQKYILANDRAGHALFEEAAQWIASTSNEDLFSFENISETLNINPDYFRRGLAVWHKRLLEAHCRTVDMPAPESPQLARVAS
jgi:hypothetical protein